MDFKKLKQDLLDSDATTLADLAIGLGICSYIQVFQIIDGDRNVIGFDWVHSSGSYEELVDEDGYSINVGPAMSHSAVKERMTNWILETIHDILLDDDPREIQAIIDRYI